MRIVAVVFSHANAARVAAFCACLAGYSLAPCALAAAPDIIGEAFHLSSADLLYREFHLMDEVRKQHRVEYRGGDGTLKVLKDVEGDSNDTRPAFSQIDLRNNRATITRREQGHWRVQLGQLIKGEQGQSVTPPLSNNDIELEKELAFKDSEELVIDTGFDAMIRSRWSQLAAGESLIFPFGVPSRGKTVALKVRKVAASKCERKTEYIGSMTRPASEQLARSCFKVNAKSWLLRVVLAPVYISYYDGMRRLYSYAGISNIRSDKGKVQKVFIRYHYPAADRVSLDEIADVRIPAIAGPAYK